ncbi:PHD finger protein 7-like [Struthio camelus]|uniref:PHD finger protein 7-like n=1 Tax=Struthio camelus TaxID=8801 RepID=UPI003603FB90
MKRQAAQEGACGLCQRADCDPEVFGQMCRRDGLCIHENCLYHASGLSQRGADGEGFYGFLFPDIRRELRRAARKTCCICRRRGASVACRGRRCPRNFHFPCGGERGCVSQFFGEFKSFCWQHRPVQRAQAPQRGQTPCLICQEAVAGRPRFGTLVCPACRSAWFHRGCIQVRAPRRPRSPGPSPAPSPAGDGGSRPAASLRQGQALRSALHHFRCPLCQDVETFQAEMFRLGIKIPDRDAAWEEEGAFDDHYRRHSSCDASRCLCPAGRQQAQEEGPWRLLLCDSCGSRGTHRRCGSVPEAAGTWECGDCAGPGSAKIVSLS